MTYQEKVVNLLTSLERQSKPWLLLAGFALIGAIGLLDFLTGYEFAFSLFYVFPIALITWLTSRRWGLAASTTSACVWLIADIASRNHYSSPLVPIWNTLIRFAFFVIITFLLSALKSAVDRESSLARVDYLTGAANSRYFNLLAKMEIDRFQRYRHAFSLAYLDLDNFKTVNDQFGHSVGDQVLSTVVSCIKTNMRRIDMVARLGGDEFALLLPETDQEAARAAIQKLQSNLLETMQRNNWPVTFSIGVLTCTAAPATTDELLKIADDLMYSVKRDGKNASKYFTYAG